MAGTEITDLLRAEIQNYLGIPYFRNKPSNNKTDNAHVGKGDCKEIALATVEAANDQNLKLLDFDTTAIYNFQKKNGIGIDCSGLAYHLLNKLSMLLRQTNIENDLIGTEGKRGVRRLNADLLTSSPNAIPVTNYSQVQTGDLIRMDGGSHVVLIVSATDKQLSYVHSSDRTQIRGVHYGVITITHPQKDLSFQTWSDTTKDGKPYSKLFNSKNGDGIYRLKIFS